MKYLIKIITIILIGVVPLIVITKKTLLNSQPTIINNAVITTSQGYAINRHYDRHHNGAVINLWIRNYHKSQRWYFYNDGTIRSYTNPNYCLNLHNNKLVANATINLWRCNGHNSQKWKVQGNLIRSAQNENFVINLHHNTHKNDAKINLWPANNNQSQKWYLKKGSLFIRNMDIYDNGEGDSFPHGPHASLHCLIFPDGTPDPGNRRSYSGFLTTTHIHGPSCFRDMLDVLHFPPFRRKCEWLDGDKKTVHAKVYDWPDNITHVMVMIYESDPHRDHDVLFYKRISRDQTIFRDNILFSSRKAASDALANCRKRKVPVPHGAKVKLNLVTR